MTQSHDTLLRFLLPAAGVRGVAVSLDAAWQAIASRAHYPAAVSELLGEASAAAALFTGHTYLPNAPLTAACAASRTLAKPARRLPATYSN